MFSFTRSLVRALPAIFLFNLVYDYFNQVLMARLALGPTSSELLILGSFTLLNSLVFPLLATGAGLLILRGQLIPNKANSILNDFHQLFIESVRAWGKILQGFLFLIIPGIYRGITLSFVGYVVLLDPRYQAGEIDALRESKKKIKMVWWQVLLILFFFYLVIPGVFTTLTDEYRSFEKFPLPNTLLGLVDSFFVFLSIWLLKFVYELACKKEAHHATNI